MREIKFRVFADGELTRPFNLKDDYKAIGYYYSRGFIVEQFTGLHDKNGKEIFESDICRFPSGLERTISFDQGGFGYIASGEFIGFAGHGYLQEIVSGCEVIGNIHENQELIND